VTNPLDRIAKRALAGRPKTPKARAEAEGPIYLRPPRNPAKRRTLAQCQEAELAHYIAQAALCGRRTTIQALAKAVGDSDVRASYFRDRDPYRLATHIRATIKRLDDRGAIRRVLGGGYTVNEEVMS